jgi:hypothetical protein
MEAENLFPTGIDPRIVQIQLNIYLERCASLKSRMVSSQSAVLWRKIVSQLRVVNRVCDGYIASFLGTRFEHVEPEVS